MTMAVATSQATTDIITTDLEQAHRELVAAQRELNASQEQYRALLDRIGRLGQTFNQRLFVYNQIKARLGL